MTIRVDDELPCHWGSSTVATKPTLIATHWSVSRGLGADNGGDIKQTLRCRWGYAVFAYGFMPLGSLVHPGMKLNFLAHKAGIYTHVFAAVVALSLSPFQFSNRLRSARPRLHRVIGRVYLGIGVAVGGLSGLYMAAFAFGGPVAKLGFACLAVCWLLTGLRAFQAIRKGDVQEHRKWVVRNVSLTLAAVTLRIYLPSSMIAGIPFELAYPVIAWLCWVPNLVVAELVFTGSYKNSLKPKPLASST